MQGVLKNKAEEAQDDDDQYVGLGMQCGGTGPSSLSILVRRQVIVVGDADGTGFPGSNLPNL